MKKLSPTKNLVIYQAKSGAIEFRGDFTHDTIWATQAQIAEVFGVNVRTVNEHLKNIYKTEELEEIATIRKFRIVQVEGNRTVEREVNHYNLDTIISVGYRVNSKTATEFRKWATKTLREYITKGYVLDRKKIQKNYAEFLETITTIQNLLPEQGNIDPKLVLELVKEFSSTWTALDAYDKESLKAIGTTKKSIKLSGEELTKAIGDLRTILIKQGEATEMFAEEKHKGNIEGIVGSVMQSFGGKDVYPTLEEKASHLLYFMVKNHPFTDGNKRSGAFAFVWFLNKTKLLNRNKITPEALTALTLLIAESNPKNKEQMTGLIVSLLKK